MDSCTYGKSAKPESSSPPIQLSNIPYVFVSNSQAQSEKFASTSQAELVLRTFSIFSIGLKNEGMQVREYVLKFGLLRLIQLYASRTCTRRSIRIPNQLLLFMERLLNIRWKFG